MALYLLLCMPLAVLIISSLTLTGALPTRGPQDSIALVTRCFLVGVIAALPSELVLVVLEPLLGRSYRPARLYFSAFLLDHGLSCLLAAVSYLVAFVVPVLMKRRNGLTSFTETVAFLGGFFAVLAVSDFIGARPELSIQVLFLVPTLRLVTVLLYARALERLEGSRGTEIILPAGAFVLWPALAGFEGLWYRMGRVGAATMFTVGAALLIGAALAAALARRGQRTRPQADEGKAP